MGRMSTPRSSNASVKSSDHTAKSSIGMDLIDEISISVKKTKATHYPHEKVGWSLIFSFGPLLMGFLCS